MANEEHLRRLKRGRTVWEAWRNKNPRIQPDLRDADLFGRDLMFTDLTGADLRRASLTWTKFIRAKFTRAKLFEANLTGADLCSADLIKAQLPRADLTRANLYRADLSEADLSGAKVPAADLRNATLSRAILPGVDFSGATLGWTTLGDVDLSTVQGLETVRHVGPSTIGIDTLYRSNGQIPEAFLRGAGVPEDLITYGQALVVPPFQYHSCFISYSNRDNAPARRLYADLQDKGVRCFFAPEDLKIGDEFRSRIDESIQAYDRLLLILSKHSVNSRWVQKEVETAFEKEATVLDVKSVMLEG